MKDVKLVLDLAKIAFRPPNASSSGKEALASGDLEKKAEGGRWAKPGRERVWKP
jgi:hypothetical protein